MKLALNVFAGLAASVWAAALSLAVVPFYLRTLGVEAYGLIGFFTTLQVLLQLLDAGLSTTMNREVARNSASGSLGQARTVLRTLAVVYGAVAALIGVAILASASIIATRWLGSSTIAHADLTRAIALMGLVIACRWPIALYQGALVGSQRLTVSSGLQATMVTIGQLGAVLVLSLWSPTIQAFFLWQAIVALAYVYTIRLAAWRAIGRDKAARFDLAILKRIWRFSAGMSGTAVAAAVLTQMDKVLLSRMLTLEDFGHYTLAAVVASSLYIVIAPVFNAVYPRFSALVSQGDLDGLVVLYRRGTKLMCSALFPLGIGIAVFAEDLLAVWTGQPKLAASAGPIVSLLILGTMLNGVMHFPYALQLAYGLVRLPLLVAASLAVLLLPSIVYLTRSYGAVGGAAAWLLVNAAYVLVGTVVTHLQLLKGIGSRWLVIDVGVPLAITLIVVGGGAFVLRYRDGAAHAPLFGLVWAVALMAAASAAALLVVPETRRWMGQLHKKTHLSASARES